jgi:hypothetical protein
VTMHMFFHFDGRRNLFLLLIFLNSAALHSEWKKSVRLLRALPTGRQARNDGVG